VIKSAGPRRTLASFACLLLLLVFSGFVAAQTKAEKTPLYWAQMLVSGLRPENTSYQHKQGFIKWKGENGVTEYESRTDCSGFLNFLLERSYALTPDDFEKWLGKRRPLAVEYFEAISQQQNFRRIQNIKDVRPDDIIAVRYPPGTNENTGHIMLVAEAPVHRKSTKPEVDGTDQWEVSIIDSSESGHGKTDTRHKPDATFWQGVGQGVLRLYTKPSGEIVGYTWSTLSGLEHFYSTYRQLFIGRLRLSRK
jgi:hypothetical protein